MRNSKAFFQVLSPVFLEFAKNEPKNHGGHAKRRVPEGHLHKELKRHQDHLHSCLLPLQRILFLVPLNHLNLAGLIPPLLNHLILFELFLLLSPFGVQAETNHKGKSGLLHPIQRKKARSLLRVHAEHRSQVLRGLFGTPAEVRLHRHPELRVP